MTNPPSLRRPPPQSAAKSGAVGVTIYCCDRHCRPSIFATECRTGPNCQVLFMNSIFSAAAASPSSGCPPRRCGPRPEMRWWCGGCSTRCWSTWAGCRRPRARSAAHMPGRRGSAFTDPRGRRDRPPGLRPGHRRIAEADGGRPGADRCGRVRPATAHTLSVTDEQRLACRPPLTSRLALVPLDPAHAGAAVGGFDGAPGPRESAQPAVRRPQQHRGVSAHLDGRVECTGPEVKLRADR